MSFYKLGIKGDLVYSLELKNISTPTPIQSLSIPHILNGKDLVAEAQTGTGKTYAFLLPMFQKMDVENPSIQGLVIAPTRELALQITDVAKQLSEMKPINILTAYGGQDVLAQLHKLKGDIQLVIGTPGRILDHLRRGSIDLSHLSTLVVDEADQMFNIGFMEQVDMIIEQLPSERQTLCFSATISQNIDLFTDKYLVAPVFVKAPKKQITLDNITQLVVETSGRKKLDDFMTILKRDKPQNAIIFCRSRVGTDVLYEAMLAACYKVEAIHGGLTQAKREDVMAKFRNNEINYLVATDVAARGIDIDGISHVFNYNLPDDIENYVHRIGRTGRAGNAGVAYTILTLKDEKRLEDVEAFIGMKLDRIRVSEPPQIHENKLKTDHKTKYPGEKNGKNVNIERSSEINSQKKPTIKSATDNSMTANKIAKKSTSPAEASNRNNANKKRNSNNKNAKRR